MSSSLTAPAKKEPTRSGGFLFGIVMERLELIAVVLFGIVMERLELIAVVNEAPVALQSRDLSEPAGECSSPCWLPTRSGGFLFGIVMERLELIAVLKRQWRFRTAI